MVARPVRKRMYRTMQGRMVDIEKLRAVNENVRAIGNMNVNARGDVIGMGGHVVKSKETVIIDGTPDEIAEKLVDVLKNEIKVMH